MVLVQVLNDSSLIPTLIRTSLLQLKIYTKMKVIILELLKIMVFVDSQWVT